MSNTVDKLMLARRDEWKNRWKIGYSGSFESLKAYIISLLLLL